MLQIRPTQENESKFISYIMNVMVQQSPFDAKLKSLVILKKILDKWLKLVSITVPLLIDVIHRKNIVDELLRYFNPEIFKRYVPILKIISESNKKSLNQNQIDTLFKILKGCHESEQ